MIALLTRDLRLALRAGGGFGLGLAFFLLVAVLVPLGVGPESATLAKIAPGIPAETRSMSSLGSKTSRSASATPPGASGSKRARTAPFEQTASPRALPS